MRFIKNFIFAILIVFSSLFSVSTAYALPTVKASLDSVNLLMGNMTVLHLTVTQPVGTKGEFPLLSRLRDDGIIPLCGDSIELRAPSVIDTTINGNILNIKYEVPLQAFDSGYYKLPEFVYVTGKDSISSNSLGLKVYPVLADADTPIYDYASVAEPENPSIFDVIPDWIIDLWWLWIVIVLAIVIFMYAMKRYRRDGYIIPKKPEPTPYEVAMASMLELKEKKLWEQGLEKEYFTDLTDILRNYLYGRFGINAMEMTSRQILSSLKANDELKEKRSYFRQILDMADFVKFAKVRPLPDDNVAAYDNAWRFIQETKPLPVENKGDNVLEEGGAQ